VKEFFMKRRRIKGQALVELALFFPFFLLIILGGIIDFGFAFYNYISLQQVANDSVQWAADREITTFGEISGAVHKNIAKLGWKAALLTIHPLEFPEFTSLGEDYKGIKLTLTYNSPVYTPFYQTMFSATLGTPYIPLRTSVTYRISKVLKKR